jgi:hypothetical protein
MVKVPVQGNVLVVVAANPGTAKLTYMELPTGQVGALYRATRGLAVAVIAGVVETRGVMAYGTEIVDVWLVLRFRAVRITI